MAVSGIALVKVASNDKLLVAVVAPKLHIKLLMQQAYRCVSSRAMSISSASRCALLLLAIGQVSFIGIQ